MMIHIEKNDGKTGTKNHNEKYEVKSKRARMAGLAAAKKFCFFSLKRSDETKKRNEMMKRKIEPKDMNENERWKRQIETNSRNERCE
jgi:hypothetical protein